MECIITECAHREVYYRKQNEDMHNWGPYLNRIISDFALYQATLQRVYSVYTDQYEKDKG